MALPDEVREALEVFDQSQGARDRLNDWERNFMTDQQQRVTEYGDNTRWSVKQIAAIEKIYKKMMGLT